MIQKKSVAARLAIGKTTGLVTGILAVLMLPSFGYPMLSFFALGTILMFMLMGVTIAFIGQYSKHPLFDISLHWWLRGPVIGLTFMLMYVLFNYDELQTIIDSSIGMWTGLNSPFWALLDGIFLGGLMGYIQTKIAGEGEELPLK